MVSKTLVAGVAALAVLGGIGTFVFLRDSDGDGVNDLTDRFPTDRAEWRDSDGDRVGDNADVFPHDPTETSDFDSDGTGDNADLDDDNDSMPDTWEAAYGLDSRDSKDGTEDGDGDLLLNHREYATRASPVDRDTDDDGPIDGLDIEPAVDVIVAFQYTRFRVEDPIDIGTQGDVYFTISMNEVATLTSSVIYYDMDAGEIPADYTVIFNVPDDRAVVHFRTTWMDRDFLFDDELDVSGVGNALDVDYDLQAHTWTGDDTDGEVSGNDDGSTSWDEDDLTVWYRVFDSVGHPDEIDTVLADMGSASGLEDFSQAVRTMGHVILESLVSWALDHPSFFLRYGSWGALLASGLTILAVVVKFYRLVFLQNDDK